jgi:hypothetical protein
MIVFKKLPFPSAEQLRAKMGKTMLGCAVAGHREFLRRGNEGEGKIIPAQVLPVLQGRGPERKEAFLLTAILVTFGASKVTALPAANERADVLGYSKVISLPKQT